MKRILIILIIAVLFGCSANKNSKDQPIDLKVQTADDLFSKKKYDKAIKIYQEIVFERNSKFTSYSQNRTAECYFLQKKYPEARLEYEELLRLFPDYKDINLGYFRIGYCFFMESLPPQYTQEETKKAIDALQVFLDKFPGDSLSKEALDIIAQCQYKLIEKKYYNGYIYYRIDDYSGAMLYLDEVIDLGNTNDVDRKSLYYACKISYERKDKPAFKIYFDKLTAKYPLSKETKKITKLSTKL